MGFLGLAREPEGRPLQHPSSPGSGPWIRGRLHGSKQPGCARLPGGREPPASGREPPLRNGPSTACAGHLSSDAPDVSSNLWADPSGGKQAPGQTPLAPAGRLAKLHKLRGKRAPSEVLTLLTEVEGCRARLGRAAGVRRGRYQV